MKQKKKIIILLSSFLSGISLIFFSLRDNNNQQKNNKNNLLIKKEEEKENNKNHQQSSLFFFWMITGIIILIIIGISIYQYLFKKESNNQGNVINKNNQQKNNVNPPSTIDNQEKKSNAKQIKKNNPETTKIINNNLNNPTNISSAPPVVINNNYLLDLEKYQNYTCGLKFYKFPGAGKAGIEKERINIIFDQNWDANSFFNQLWKLDVEDHCYTIEDKQFYFNLSKQLNVKNEIKKFFSLMIDVLQTIKIQIFNDLLLNEQKYHKCCKLLAMAKELLKNQKNLDLMTVASGSVSYQDNEQLANAYQNGDQLAVFKIVMQDDKNIYCLKSTTPFRCFYSLYRYHIQPLQKELNEFCLLNKNNKEYQQLSIKLQNKKTDIDNFFNTKKTN